MNGHFEILLKLHNMQIILKQGKFLSIYTVIQLFIASALYIVIYHEQNIRAASEMEF